MKNTLLFVVTVIVCSACSNDEQLNFYGEKISTGNAIAPTAFLAEINDKDSVATKVEAKIIETCSMKGCWMTVDLGNGEEMRVTFKDYGFFVPKDSVEGKKVIFEGVAKKTTTDVATLKHYAEDAGKSVEEIAAITGSKEEITFVATGVAIKDVQE